MAWGNRVIGLFKVKGQKGKGKKKIKDKDEKRKKISLLVKIYEDTAGAGGEQSRREGEGKLAKVK